MRDDIEPAPDHDPESEISDHVNDYLEGLRARFDELTDRIEEASKASIDRNRASLDETIEAPEHPGPIADREHPEPIPARGEMPPAPPPPPAAAPAHEPPPAATPPATPPPAAVHEPAATAAAFAATPPPAPPPAATVAPQDPAPRATAPSRMPRPVNRRSSESRTWLVGALAILIVVSAAFLAGRWWSGRDDAAATAPTTTTPVTQPEAGAPGDGEIETAVTAEIAAIAAANVTAHVDSGTVVLMGTVATAADRDALSSAILAMDGVRQLDNRIEVVTPIPPDVGDIQAAADAARVATGFEYLDVTVTDGVAVVAGVVPVANVADGIFASIRPLTDALGDINGVDSIVTRLQLRGDEAALRSELHDLIDAQPIIFASNSAELDAATAAALDQAAEIINSYPGLRVLIAGHTDAAGGTSQNEQLAAARGQAVLGYLLSRGVPITRLQVVSYGELFPGGGSNQSLNRRIEFEVAP